eukprot:CAMPEP_0194345548 /NCGR_PEP_ID=MMETSP0171-20130528/104914_1 /TAXON_ID=218684 /ORGANISM="Corethron pennatum, Strain L29A3" /LENGTH=802 /DNA_ID=CAMNT_0039112547 /DNA_START=71 /DNA_END=2476 /DNA_ORIENTATION=+
MINFMRLPRRKYMSEDEDHDKLFSRINRRTGFILLNGRHTSLIPEFGERNISFEDDDNGEVIEDLHTNVSRVNDNGGFNRGRISRRAGFRVSVSGEILEEIDPSRDAILVSAKREMTERQMSVLFDNSNNNHFRVMVRNERRLEWLCSFRRLDPRYMILRFFNDVTREGAGRIEEADQSICNSYECSPLLQYFSKASAFSVWRPTSNDSIRKMIIGEGTGKGLDVKGKSARKGMLSGFIPFVQIHEESHKKEIRRPPKDGMMRIFYKNEAARNTAVLEFTSISTEMAATVTEARATLSRRNSVEDQRVLASSNLLLDVVDPKIQLLDDYSPLFFGVNVAQRIVFKAYIMKQDIGRGPIHDTGRPSEPAFQDMNFKCVRDYSGDGPPLRRPHDTGRPSEPAFQDMNFTCVRDYSGDGPRSVVLQLSEAPTNALRPQELVVAYEENGRIVPVVSDFDCFLVGTRSLDYSTPLPESQIRLLKALLAQIEGILDSPITSESWTKRWLEVLKQVATSRSKNCPVTPKFGFGDPKSYAIMENVVSRLKLNGAVRHGADASTTILKKVATNNTIPTMPQFGFGDPKSYAIMENVVSRLELNGAVRHGAESFNYTFPQELDESFLVIDERLDSKVPWKYVGVQELRELLCARIDEGYVFPLNPKWILADYGWKAVYDKMMSSTNERVQGALAVWYPPESGIRELIEDIHSRFPDGFQRLSVENGDEDDKLEGTEGWDLAEQKLQRHLMVRRVKWYPPESGIRELIEDIHSRFPDGFQRLSVENGDQDDKLEGRESLDLAKHSLKRHIVVW